MQENDINGYPECERCGKCCNISVIAMTIEEAERIFAYAEENNIQPRDLGEGTCPWRGNDMLCRIWEARCQTCRLHGCRKTRYEVLTEHPELKVNEDMWLVDMRQVFLFRNFEDPRK